MPNDAGKGPSKFGINQAANPDVDVNNINEQQARNLYQQRYWNAIGADKLPENMRMVAFDTAVNFGPGAAKQMLQQAANDPQKLIELRRAKHAALIKASPNRFGKYEKSWQSRNDKLAAMLQPIQPEEGVQYAQAQPSVTTDASVDSVSKPSWEANFVEEPTSPEQTQQSREEAQKRYESDVEKQNNDAFSFGYDPKKSFLDNAPPYQMIRNVAKGIPQGARTGVAALQGLLNGLPEGVRPFVPVPTPEASMMVANALSSDKRDLADLTKGVKREDLINDVTKKNELAGKGTGLYATIGETLGDPRYAATLPLAMEGWLARAGIGGALGASEPTHNVGQEGEWEDRGLNALKTSALLTALPWAPQAISATGKAVKFAGYTLPKSIFEATRPLTKKGQQVIAGRKLASLSEAPKTLYDRIGSGINEIVAGSKPTTAQASQDVGLAAAERTLSGDPVRASQMAGIKSAQNVARQNLLDAQATSKEGASAVADFVKNRMSQFKGATNDIIQKAQNSAVQKINALGADITPQAAGKIIKNEFDDAYKVARAATKTAYESIDPSNKSKILIQKAKYNINDAINKYYGRGSGGMDSELSGLVDDFTGMQPKEGYQTLQRLRTRASEIANKATLAEDRTKASVAKIVKDEIDNALSVAAETGKGFSKKGAKAFNLAKGLRTEQAKMFEEGAAKNLAKGKVPDSGVVQEYLFSGVGSPEAATQFTKSLGGRPNAVKALKDFAVSDLRNYATNADGTLNQAKYFQWMKKYAPALKQFPELQKDMIRAGKSQQAAERLLGRQERALEDVEKGAAGYFLKQNPDDAIATVFNSKNSEKLADDLWNKVKKSPDATAGLQKAAIDFIKNKSLAEGTDSAGNRILSHAKYNKTLRENYNILSKFMRKEHLDNMMRVAADLNRAAISETGGRASGSNTFQNFGIGNVVNTLFGPEAKRNLLTSPIGRFIENSRLAGYIYGRSEDQIREMIYDALIDPQIARTLLQQIKPANATNVANKLADRLSALGFVASKPATTKAATIVPKATE